MWYKIWRRRGRCIRRMNDDFCQPARMMTRRRNAGVRVDSYAEADGHLLDRAGNEIGIACLLIAGVRFPEPR